MKFTKVEQKGNKIFEINISVSDGFSLTGSVYEYQKGRRKNNYDEFLTKDGKTYFLISSGAVGDEIARNFPKYEIFNSLHLSDLNGIPLYAVENGYYHLTNGFNNVKTTDNNFEDKYKKYYRLSNKQFEKVKKARNQTHFAMLLKEVHVLDTWKHEAEEAIKKFEILTEKKFIYPDKIDSYFHYPTIEEIKDFEDKNSSGYFTKEATNERKLQKEQDYFHNKVNDFENKKLLIDKEIDVFKQIFNHGGEFLASNYIFYTHSKTVAFNWRGYEKSKVTLLDVEGLEIEGVKIEVR